MYVKNTVFVKQFVLCLLISFSITFSKIYKVAIESWTEWSPRFKRGKIKAGIRLILTYCSGLTFESRKNTLKGFYFSFTGATQEGLFTCVKGWGLSSCFLHV